MIDVVWAILRQNSRFLLAQRSILDRAGGTWTFPGGEVGPEDIDTIAAVHRELKEEVGLQGSRFLKMFHVCLNQYRVQFFLCDTWRGEPKPSCDNIIGIGWFTGVEMYTICPILEPQLGEILPHLLYWIQHYDNHLNEWKERWRECDDNG